MIITPNAIVFAGRKDIKKWRERNTKVHNISLNYLEDMTNTHSQSRDTAPFGCGNHNNYIREGRFGPS